MIEKVKDSHVIEVNGFEDQAIKLSQNGQSQTLFTQNDIPKTLLPETEFRIASLAYQEADNTLIISLQILKDENHPSFVRILKYDLKDHTFSLVGDIKEHHHEPNVGIAGTAVHASGKALSLDLFTEGKEQTRFYTVIYEMDTHTLVEMDDMFTDTKIDNMRSNWWDGDDLVFDTQSQGLTLRYKYNMKNHILKGF